MSVELLVTGGSGLVGCALREIVPEATFLNRKDSDLTDLCKVRNLFEQFKPKKIIHCAAEVGGVKRNAEKNADMFTLNVQINTNVLNVAQQCKAEKLVTVLSNCVFQEHPEKPPTEKEIHKQMPFHGHLGYGYAKRMLDLQIHLLREQYGCNFTSITPVTIFGPNDNWDLNESHVVGSLIHKCFLAKKNGTPLELWGSGKAVRQFVYSLDVARILMEVLEKYDDPSTIIVAPEKGIAIRTLAETVVKLMNFPGPIAFDQSKPEGESVRVLDSSKFRSLFPDFKFTPLETALKSTIEWFEKNYKIQGSPLQKCEN